MNLLRAILKAMCFVAAIFSLFGGCFFAWCELYDHGYYWAIPILFIVVVGVVIGFSDWYTNRGFIS